MAYFTPDPEDFAELWVGLPAATPPIGPGITDADQSRDRGLWLECQHLVRVAPRVCRPLLDAAAPARMLDAQQDCDSARGARLIFTVEFTSASTVIAAEQQQGTSPVAPITAAIITATAALIVALIANNIWRQTKVKMAEYRQKAYASLWEIIEVTSWNGPPLGGRARKRVFYKMTRWYYEEGNGMLLPAKTFTLWEKVRENLVCSDKNMEPPRLGELLKDYQTKYKTELPKNYRGDISMNQFSLLRTQMKADLAVYRADISQGKLDRWDSYLLKSCKIRLCKKPWREAQRTKVPARVFNITCLLVGVGCLLFGTALLLSDLGPLGLPWESIPKKWTFLIPVLLIVVSVPIVVWGPGVLTVVWGDKAANDMPWKPPSGSRVDVAFRLPAARKAYSAHLCGEFNDWSTTADPMDRLDNGSFELTRALPVGQRWHFRYLLNGNRWENDWAADDYTPNAFGDQDSVVDLQTPPTSRLVNIDEITWENIDEADTSIRKGFIGNPVRLAQERLTLGGYDTNGVDGVFDSDTEAAVRRF